MKHDRSDFTRGYVPREVRGEGRERDEGSGQGETGPPSCHLYTRAIKYTLLPARGSSDLFLDTQSFQYFVFTQDFWQTRLPPRRTPHDQRDMLLPIINYGERRFPESCVVFHCYYNSGRNGFPPDPQLLRRKAKWFRGGLVFKAHRLLYHPTLGLSVIKKKKTHGARRRQSHDQRDTVEPRS